METRSIEAYKTRRPQDYDEFIQVAGVKHAEALDAVRDMIRVEPLSVLELGTGTGLLTERILKRHPRTRLTGVDGSSEMLRSGRGRLEPFGERFIPVVSSFETCDWESLPGRPFDLIVTSFALHHMEHSGYPRFFSRLLGLLRPGGQFLAADLIKSSFEGVWSHYLDVWVEARRRQTLERLGVSRGFDELRSEHLRDMEEEGDNPAPLPDLVSWLSQAGFAEAEAHWRYYWIAVYGGLRPPI